LQLTLVKNVNVANEVAFDWSIANTDQLTLSTDQIEYFFHMLLNTTTTPEERQRIIDMHNQPGIVYYPAQISIAPSSFDVTVVTQKNTYGLLPFLSDLGGFLNLLALSFTLLFPFAHAFIRPRMFVALYLHKVIQRWRGVESKSSQSDPVSNKNVALQQLQPTDVIASDVDLTSSIHEDMTAIMHTPHTGRPRCDCFHPRQDPIQRIRLALTIMRSGPTIVVICESPLLRRCVPLLSCRWYGCNKYDIEDPTRLPTAFRSRVLER
jgi:hypothetical protein